MNKTLQRTLLVAVSLSSMHIACSSSPAPSVAPDAGYCASNGYESPSGGTCPKGTCFASGAAAACCGSACASCEAKGLSSYTSSGQCPTGLCPSADVTASLACCDACSPLNPADAGLVESGPGMPPGDGGMSESSAD